jgi:hypothetical protein
MNAPLRELDFVSGLCIALAHRFEPERLFLFVYTGYLDESGTHDGSAATVMGGVLARADQWQKFQKGFDRVKKEHGFRIFHTKKFKNKRGDFEGWTNQQCLALIGDLAGLTDIGLTDGVLPSH